MYQTAPINDFFSPILTISDQQASITMNVQSKFFHDKQYLHGSVFFKLLDDAAFFAAQSIEFDMFIVTASFATTFIRPVNQGTLTATGTFITKTKNQYFADSIITNDENKIVAKGTGIFVKSTLSL